jgi:hypothetical protein
MNNKLKKEIIDALTTYCNSGQIDCADSLLAAVLYDQEFPEVDGKTLKHIGWSHQDYTFPLKFRRVQEAPAEWADNAVAVYLEIKE